MDSFGGSLKKRVTDAKDKIVESGTLSTDRVNLILEEYRRVLLMLKDFGLEVGKLRVMASVPPEISTTIIGSIDRINEDRVKEMQVAHPDKKLLSAILSALQTTIHIRKAIDLGELSDIRIDISLGIPPRVAVDLVEPQSRLLMP
jgi:hypothetical protein